MSLSYAVSGAVSNQELNALFSTGWPSWQTAPDTSDWEPVLKQSLTYVIARNDESLVGFVNVAWDGRTHAFLLDTCVDPDYRHRGIGIELVRRATDAVSEAGCEWLHVDYEPDLGPFYEACGFKPTAAGILRLE